MRTVDSNYNGKPIDNCFDCQYVTLYKEHGIKHCACEALYTKYLAENRADPPTDEDVIDEVLTAGGISDKCPFLNEILT